MARHRSGTNHAAARRRPSRTALLHTVAFGLVLMISGCSLEKINDSVPPPDPAPLNPSGGVTRPALPLPLTQPLVNLKSAGAACDGHTDDRPALERALRQVQRDGGTILVPPGARCIVRAPADGATLSLGNDVRIIAEGQPATLELRDGPGRPPTGLFSIKGNRTAISNLILTSSTTAPSTLVTVNHGESTVINAVTFTAFTERQSQNHGLRFSGSSTEEIQNLRIENSRFHSLDFGIFMSNTDQQTVRNLMITHSAFTYNRADDVELNAPSGTLTGVTIAETSFEDNQYDASENAAGFGIGLARAHDVSLRHNHFRGYKGSPIHIEDQSSKVHVLGNHFTSVATGTKAHGIVSILSGSGGVTIESNTFDLRDNIREQAAVFVTAGSPTSQEPQEVVLRGNRYALGAAGTELLDATSGSVCKEHE